MSGASYQHPITFVPSGDLKRDFAHSFDEYDNNLGVFLPPRPDLAILDIGCGWGQFLAWLRARGYTAATGIDVGGQQVEFCRAQGFQAIQVDDSRLFLESRPGTHDLIALHHVIEHVPTGDGLSLLRAVRTALRPGGRVLVQTPNMSAASASFTRYIEISHVTGYTETSLAEILSFAGLEDVRVFGSRTPLRLRPRRLAWLALRVFTRTLWRLLLIAELGSDAPKHLEKSLFGTGIRTATRSE
jgi:SAM-dependent methyltransferase